MPHTLAHHPSKRATHASTNSTPFLKLVPEHVVNELKLHSVELNGRKVVIEKAKTPPKKTTGKNRQAFLQTQS